MSLKGHIILYHQEFLENLVRAALLADEEQVKVLLHSSSFAFYNKKNNRKLGSLTFHFLFEAQGGRGIRVDTAVKEDSFVTMPDDLNHLNWQFAGDHSTEWYAGISNTFHESCRVFLAGKRHGADKVDIMHEALPATPYFGRFVQIQRRNPDGSVYKDDGFLRNMREWVQAKPEIISFGDNVDLS